MDSGANAQVTALAAHVAARLGTRLSLHPCHSQDHNSHFRFVRRR